MDDLMLSTNEVADVLGVHPSTAKRWLDEPGWRVDRTEGGHRRVPFADVLELADAHVGATALAPFHPFEAHVWKALVSAEKGDQDPLVALALGWVRYGDPAQVTRLFDLLRTRGNLSLAALADGPIARFMRALGEGWRTGKVGVADEHIVTHLMVQTLYGWRAATPSPTDDRPVQAVVLCAEGNHHEMAALATATLLDERGYRSWYLGADVGPAEAVGAGASRGAELLCVSFAAPQEHPDVIRMLEGLERFATGGQALDVVIGGAPTRGYARERSGGPLRSVTVVDSLAELGAYLDSTSGDTA